MTNFLSKSLSPQSISIYALLQKSGTLTAKEIGDTLKIFPHAVYRSAKPLEEIGLLIKSDTYPIRYEVQSVIASSELLSLTIQDNFNELFGKNSANYYPTKLLNITFIKDRNDLLEKTSSDIRTAKQSIDFIVSGLEIPAESVLSFKEASKKRLVMRAIIQNRSEATTGLLRTWKNLGVNIRYYPNMEARIFIIDSKIVYFTSYNQEEKDSGTGVRFHSIPFARLMKELFEQRWQVAALL